jgi:hypothetical protein
MKITKENIKKIIAEELHKELSEVDMAQQSANSPLFQALKLLGKAGEEFPTNRPLRNAVRLAFMIVDQLQDIAENDTTDPAVRKKEIERNMKGLKTQVDSLAQVIPTLAGQGGTGRTMDASPLNRARQAGLDMSKDFSE